MKKLRAISKRKHKVILNWILNNPVAMFYRAIYSEIPDTNAFDYEGIAGELQKYQLETLYGLKLKERGLT